jgi:hypothetical protein
VTWGWHGRSRDKHDRLALELNCKSKRDKANRRKQRDGSNGEPQLSLLALPGFSCSYRGLPVVSGRRVVITMRTFGPHAERGLGRS